MTKQRRRDSLNLERCQKLFNDIVSRNPEYEKNRRIQGLKVFWSKPQTAKHIRSLTKAIPRRKDAWMQFFQLLTSAAYEADNIRKARAPKNYRRDLNDVVFPLLHFLKRDRFFPYSSEEKDLLVSQLERIHKMCISRTTIIFHPLDHIPQRIRPNRSGGKRNWFICNVDSIIRIYGRKKTLTSFLRDISKAAFPEIKIISTSQVKNIVAYDNPVNFVE